MAEPDRRVVEYFSVLARARHLLPEAQAVLDHRALVDPDRMDKAVRMCGIKPEWERFDPEDSLQFKQLAAVIRGDAYVVGHSAHDPSLQVVQVACDELESIQHQVDFCFDVTLIGVTDPIVGLVHHEALCTVVRCIPAPGTPEAPRDLGQRLLAQVEQRREKALGALLPSVRQSVLSLLGDRRRIDAIKYLRAELGSSLLDAKNIIDAIDPWWPSGLSGAMGKSAATDPGGES